MASEGVVLVAAALSLYIAAAVAHAGAGHRQLNLQLAVTSEFRTGSYISLQNSEMN
jgi:hypothetical protein